MFLLHSINTATAQPLSKAQETVVCMFPHWNWQLEEVWIHKTIISSSLRFLLCHRCVTVSPPGVRVRYCYSSPVSLTPNHIFLIHRNCNTDNDEVNQLQQESVRPKKQAYFAESPVLLQPCKYLRSESHIHITLHVKVFTREVECLSLRNQQKDTSRKGAQRNCKPQCWYAK